MLSAFPIAAVIVLAVTSCTGETDYDVLDDYNATSADPTIAAAQPSDPGARATTSRGTDAGTVAHRPDASAPPPTPPQVATDASAPLPAPAPAPAPAKKKGKHHEDD